MTVTESAGGFWVSGVFGGRMFVKQRPDGSFYMFENRMIKVTPPLVVTIAVQNYLKDNPRELPKILPEVDFENFVGE